MMPGEALDAQDILFRSDGAFYKHWGWERLNPTAATARIVGIKGFTYKGKNAPATGTARPGNFGIANDGANYTRRDAFYTSAIVLTELQCLFWNPATNALVNVALPGGVAIDLDPKPTMLVFQNNVYIFGWADQNLRYDPCDRALYIMGWDNVPANAGHTGVVAGGTLQENATYRYRLSWVDLYTGEEGELSAEYAQTTTAVNRTITLDNFIAYAGNRYYVDGVDLTDQDIGIVVYRTDANAETYYFLDLVNPGLAAATVTDNGLATDHSLRADVRDYADLPRLNFATEFGTQLWGVSWDENVARVYYNDFRSEKSFWTRWDPRNFRELPLQDGEVLTAVQKTVEGVLVFSNISAYFMDISPSVETGLIDMSLTPTEWSIGCIAPKATEFVDGWLYWLSDRGPYRWRPGSDPEWIGKNLLPMFIDNESGLCKLTETLRLESEVLYDPDSDMIRFLFPCGPGATILNRHLMYWRHAAQFNEDPASGWVFASAQAQCLDYTNVFEGLIGGVPITPFDKRNRCLFGDADGYIYEYDPASRRGALPGGVPAWGDVQAGSGVNLIVTVGGLYVNGDDMAGMRLEVVHADGTIDVRAVATNTNINIVPDVAFSQDPTGGTWYVGGIPAQWRSWVDHAGEPSSHKDMTHLYYGFNLEDPAGVATIDATVSVGQEWPTVATRSRATTLDAYRDKMLVCRTGRFFTYELSNTRPDEQFMVSYIETEMAVLEAKRR